MFIPTFMACVIVSMYYVSDSILVHFGRSPASDIRYIYHQRLIRLRYVMGTAAHQRSVYRSERRGFRMGSTTHYEISLQLIQ